LSIASACREPFFAPPPLLADVFPPPPRLGRLARSEKGSREEPAVVGPSLGCGTWLWPPPDRPVGAPEVVDCDEPWKACVVAACDWSDVERRGAGGGESVVELREGRRPTGLEVKEGESTARLSVPFQTMASAPPCLSRPGSS
jgi:hypothetical protein